MKCLLYIPQYECDGVHGKYTANVRIGGLTIYERACRSIQAAKFDEIIVAKFDALEVKPDPLIKIGVKSFDFKSSPDEISTSLIDAIGSENIAVCVLDAMVSASCFAMRPVGADVRITVGQTQTGIYFLRNDSAIELLKTPHGLDKIESTVSDTYAAPDTALYHKILTKEDTKTGQNLLTKSLRKPLGRDADGLVAYFINRPCSLQISKRIANSPITPNMITAIGLVIGLAAAALVAEVVKDFAVKGEIVAGEKLAKTLAAQVAALKSFTVVTDAALDAGFSVKLDGGRVEHAFTADVIAGELAKRLRPDLAALLK